MLFVYIFTVVGPVVAATGPHGSVELISEQAAIHPGQPFWVGLHFRLEKGWHIYWINPGDSGEPPKVQWELPAGFQAGLIRWPTPQRIQDHTMVDYGYQDEVLLPVVIRSPAGGGGDAQLSASVRWLVCRDICVPAQGRLSLTLPLAATGKPSSEGALFEQTRARLPRDAPSSWRASVKLEGRHYLLSVDTGKREDGATFFPLEPNEVDNAAPQKFSPEARGLRLELARSDQSLKPPSQLAGVLVLASGRSYFIKAPVAAAGSQP